MNEIRNDDKQLHMHMSSSKWNRQGWRIVPHATKPHSGHANNRI